MTTSEFYFVGSSVRKVDRHRADDASRVERGDARAAADRSWARSVDHFEAEIERGIVDVGREHALFQIVGCCLSLSKTLLMPATELAFCRGVNVSIATGNFRFSAVDQWPVSSYLLASTNARWRLH